MSVRCYVLKLPQQTSNLKNSLKFKNQMSSVTPQGKKAKLERPEPSSRKVKISMFKYRKLRKAPLLFFQKRHTFNNTFDLFWYINYFLTHRCQSRAFIDRVIPFLVIILTFRFRVGTVFVHVIMIFHCNNLLLLMLVVVHLGALSQSLIARWGRVFVWARDTIRGIVYIGSGFCFLVKAVEKKSDDFLNSSKYIAFVD